MQYDADGDGVVESLAFIHGRSSANVYTVAADDGGSPVPTQVPDRDWTLYRAHTSLREAAIGLPNPSIEVSFDGWSGGNNLLSAGTRWHLACYADAPDRSNTLVEGWDTSRVAYLRIFTPTSPFEVGVSQRHRGVWSVEKYHIRTETSSNRLAIHVVDAFIRIEGLQIFVTSTNSDGKYPYGINLGDFMAGRTAHVSSTIIRSDDGSGTTPFSRGIKLKALEAGTILYAWNNIIYDFGGAGPARGIELTGVGSTAYIYNTTLANVFPAIHGNSPDDLIVIRNTVAVACGGSCVSGTANYIGSNNRGEDMDGIGLPLPTDVIVDYFMATDDFHIDLTAAHSGELVDAGANLSSDAALAFDEDIDGPPRAPPWDIGADEL